MTVDNVSNRDAMSPQLMIQKSGRSGVISHKRTEDHGSRCRESGLIVEHAINDSSDGVNPAGHRDSEQSERSISGPDQIRISEQDSFSSVPVLSVPNRNLGESLMAEYSSKLKAERRQRITFAELANQDLNNRNVSLSGENGLGCSLTSRHALDLRNRSVRRNKTKTTRQGSVVVKRNLEISVCHWIICVSAYWSLLLCFLLVGYYQYLAQHQ